jgi:hypothetical protein
LRALKGFLGDTALAYDPAGRLATTDYDCHIRIWDAFK